MPGYIGLLILLIIGVGLSIYTKKLTIAGALTGGLIGLFLYLGAGYDGIVMIGAFFLLGTLATSWKMDAKQKAHIAERNKGRRNAAQVIANGGVAGISGLMAYLFPEKTTIYQLMIAASLASATADTLSSELGMVYGRKFYHILTLKKDRKGLDGVVSMEGTAFGVVGSIIIAVIYAIGFGWNINFLWIVIAGTVGNLSDSILGATLERRRFMNNDAVNFCNTAIAALCAWLLYHLFL